MIKQILVQPSMSLKYNKIYFKKNNSTFTKKKPKANTNLSSPLKAYGNLKFTAVKDINNFLQRIRSKI